MTPIWKLGGRVLTEEEYPAEDDMNLDRTLPGHLLQNFRVT